MASLTWSRQARRDLLEIYIFLASHSETMADRHFNQIEARTEQLKLHPRLGTRRPGLKPGTRVLVETPYLILYRTTPAEGDRKVHTILILRVLDGRRDLRKLLPKL